MVTIKRGQRVLFTGDSWAQSFPWHTAFLAWLNTQFTVLPPSPNPYTVAAVATGVRASATGVAGGPADSVPPTTVTSIVTGVDGSTMSALDGAAATLIVAQRPDVVFIASGGVNDARLGVTPASLASTMTSIIGKARAGNPLIQIGIMSVTFIGDKWGTGPVWNNPAYDSATEASIDALNAAVSAACTAAGAGVTYLDTRAAFLAWEVVNNPAKDASGHATGDLLHLNATGVTAIDPMVRSYITVSQAYP